MKDCTSIAILNANYLKKRLEQFYNILYKSKNNLVAHEFIIDLTDIKVLLMFVKLKYY